MSANKITGIRISVVEEGPQNVVVRRQWPRLVSLMMEKSYGNLTPSSFRRAQRAQAKLAGVN
jgi:hypothetical protein